MPARKRSFGLPDSSVHLTPAERAARGKASRAEVPRSSHAQYEPLPTRPDPVALLESQGATRVPDLVPIRYGRMLSSPFAFYRGAAFVMASDLASTPRSGLPVQACGDAHLMNFGAYGTPERNLVFDINDFDETTPGPWEWDLKRLAASLEVAGRDKGFDDASRRTVVLRAAAAYREAMTGFAAARNLDVWYAVLSVDEFMRQVQARLKAPEAKRMARTVSKARGHDSMQALDRLTEIVDGAHRIKADPPLVVPMSDVIEHFHDERDVPTAMRQIMSSYRRTLPSDRRHLIEEFDFVDVARKVVGVGSVGTRCWIILMQGRDSGDPLFLQAKEASASVLEGFVGRSRFRNSGERVVAGQRLMQSASDIFLGWDVVNGFDGVRRDFYVRQLRDWKLSADVTTMEPANLGYYGAMCAWTLAKAHARSGDRIAIAAYMGTGVVLDNAIADFAAAYADQNQRDYDALKQAVTDGRITATTGL